MSAATASTSAAACEGTSAMPPASESKAAPEDAQLLRSLQSVPLLFWSPPCPGCMGQAVPGAAPAHVQRSTVTGSRTSALSTIGAAANAASWHRIQPAANHDRHCLMDCISNLQLTTRGSARLDGHSSDKSHITLVKMIAKSAADDPVQRIGCARLSGHEAPSGVEYAPNRRAPTILP